MRVIMTSLGRTGRWARSRASAEHGFTMVIALGVLLVTSLLLTATFYAVSGEIHLGTDNLAAKRAYAAASAGVQAYLYQMNQNPNYWETCTNDTQSTAVTVPGSSDNASYTFTPIYANGNTGCTSNVINSLVDSTTGTIRIVFTGSAGTHPVVQRAMLVSFRMDSPLDFLWYTHFEAVDDGIPGGSPSYSACGVFYRNGRNSNCNIVWISGDTMNGPAYTDDQYLINTGASPTFGRTPSDKIESSAPGTKNADICSGSNCQSAIFKGTPVYNAKPIPTPSDNSELLTDAQQYGNVYSGTTQVVLSGTSATVRTCATSTTCTTSTVNLVSQPIIYVNNASGCTTSAYTPFGVTYPTNSSGYFYGCSGDVYVSGNYTTPVTIGAANNVIVAGNVTTSADSNGNPSGGATLGLVANEFVRVMHGINGSDSSSGCSTTNNASQTLTNPTIDAAILALNHSFIVDNYNCGASPGTLTVHGAIAQYFRGPVGVAGSGGGAQNGYVKGYNYDDRLANILPPYLFDISDSGWHISRETLCTPPGTGSNSTSTCQ
jgi:Tfp pilus assembly protein PilX